LGVTAPPLGQAVHAPAGAGAVPSPSVSLPQVPETSQQATQASPSLLRHVGSLIGFRPSPSTTAVELPAHSEEESFDAGALLKARVEQFEQMHNKIAVDARQFSEDLEFSRSLEFAERYKRTEGFDEKCALLTEFLMAFRAIEDLYAVKEAAFPYYEKQLVLEYAEVADAPLAWYLVSKYDDEDDMFLTPEDYADA
jgi:hypothetical protein